MGDAWTLTAPGPLARTRLSYESWGIMDSPILVPGTLPAPASGRLEYSNVRYVGSISSDVENLVVCPRKRLAADETEIRELIQSGLPLRIGARRKLWILFDLDDYYSGYPFLLADQGKGAVIRVLWAESLYDEIVSNHGTKGNRNEVDGKIFYGRGDVFEVGECHEPELFSPFWWSCGRYVALVIETADEELVLLRTGLRETLERASYYFQFYLDSAARSLFPASAVNRCLLVCRQ